MNEELSPEAVRELEQVRDELEYLAESDYPAKWVAEKMLKTLGS